MKATIIAATREVIDSTKFVNDEKTIKEQAIEFGGKQAGICYMGESYFDSAVTNTLKAVKRFHTTVGNDHHSIVDHCKVTILFEGISKMTAMILNSLQDYCTSEKSGRYTIMTGNSQIEQDLYEKWVKILTSKIKDTNSKVDDKMATKLAQENARYFLSVFTKSTTMSYTTSVRQWNYIIDWCDNYVNSHQTLNNDNGLFFNMSLVKEIKELYFTLMAFDGLYIDGLRDPNNRHFSFLVYQTNDLMEGYDICQQIGDMYRVGYTGSFVQLAQAQRHRTLKYFMLFNGKPEFFYVPSIIRGTMDLEKEWLSDMHEVAHVIPQGTLIDIIECGYIGDFFLKCNERLCGRAQHEIMLQTCDTLKKFHRYKNQFSSNVRRELDKYITCENGKYYISPKCTLRGSCKEHCIHGPLNALTRLF